MKKFKLLITLGFCSLALGACGNEEVAVPEKVTTSEFATSKEGIVAESENNNIRYTFIDNELVTPNTKIKITETKVIPVGEVGNEHGEKTVIAFWYETTNLTDEELDPSSAWIFSFTAYQDNSADGLNELNVASLPDDNFLDSQMEIIKEDGTIPNAVAYELDDNFTPVTLRAADLMIGEEIGFADYDISRSFK